MDGTETVWVVTGEHGRIPGGIFRTEELAREFIQRYSLTCTLSEYPLDESTYEHALRNDLFRPRKPHESEPRFIAEFAPRLPHYHFQNGSDDPLTFTWE
ncbi:DUF7710 domain-containing protein [Aeoliella sp. SH292]|uniref:DUF7710 domain-containing protein n=1 Tax=Aeoliella sp. SH292 TaxID=3454464 RepID=UPI003F9B6150